MGKRLKWRDFSSGIEIAKSKTDNVLVRSTSNKRRQMQFTPEEWEYFVRALKYVAPAPVDTGRD